MFQFPNLNIFAQLKMSKRAIKNGFPLSMTSTVPIIAQSRSMMSANFPIILPLSAGFIFRQGEFLFIAALAAATALSTSALSPSWTCKYISNLRISPLEGLHCQLSKKLDTIWLSDFSHQDKSLTLLCVI